MQKILMPVKPWCERTEGLESGLRAGELDAGELGTWFKNPSCRCNQVHSDHERGADLLQEQLASGYQCRQ